MRCCEVKDNSGTRQRCKLSPFLLCYLKHKKHLFTLSLNTCLKKKNKQMNVSRVWWAQDGAVRRAVSSSEDAWEDFPCSELCEILEQRREEKADIWIKSCWALSVFETEDLAANKVNWSVAYLFGWLSRVHRSLVQEAKWLLREEWGWKNIFLLRMLSQVLFPFADYSQAFFFLQLHKAHLHLGANACSWKMRFWWNVREGHFTLALSLVFSRLGSSSTCN